MQKFERIIIIERSVNEYQTIGKFGPSHTHKYLLGIRVILTLFLLWGPTYILAPSWKRLAYSLREATAFKAPIVSMQSLPFDHCLTFLFLFFLYFYPQFNVEENWQISRLKKKLPLRRGQLPLSVELQTAHWKNWWIQLTDLSPPSDWQLNLASHRSEYKHACFDRRARCLSTIVG